MQKCKNAKNKNSQGRRVFKLLIIKLNEGEYVKIGDDIKVYYDHKVTKDTINFAINAPKDVTVLRGKLYEESILKQAEEGDEKARLLAEKLKKEYRERRRKSHLRRHRSKRQEERIESGEIRPYKKESAVTT